MRLRPFPAGSPRSPPTNDRDGDDILERAAEFLAKDVAVHVEPEFATAEPSDDAPGNIGVRGDDAPGNIGVRGGDDGRRGQSTSDLHGQSRPGEGGDAGRQQPAGIGDDLPGDESGQCRSPGARADHGDARHGHQLGLRARPDAAWRRGPLAEPTGALRSFLRRGSLTDVRSRNTSRMGVPSKPNCSRSRFSR